MGFAVEVYLDPDSTREVMDRWEAIDSTNVALGASPHISLSLHESIDLSVMEQLLKEFANHHPVLMLSMPSISSFMTDECVLFMAPVVTQDLLRLHANFHRMLGEAGIESVEYYRPGKWVPHCTLDFEISREELAEKFSICHQLGGINSILLESIGLIEYRPVREYFRFPMRGFKV